MNVTRLAGLVLPTVSSKVLIDEIIGNDRHELLLPGADPRRWEPGSDIHLREQLQLPATLTPGTYRVSLWLPDAADSLRRLYLATTWSWATWTDVAG